MLVREGHAPLEYIADGQIFERVVRRRASKQPDSANEHRFATPEDAGYFMLDQYLQGLASTCPVEWHVASSQMRHGIDGRER